MEGGKHYVTIFMVGVVSDSEAEPRVMEPDKCEGEDMKEDIPSGPFWKTLEGKEKGEKKRRGRTRSNAGIIMLATICSCKHKSNNDDLLTVKESCKTNKKKHPELLMLKTGLKRTKIQRRCACFPCCKRLPGTV